MKDPVVVFALEWCEFCWSLKKFLAAANVPFTTVDLDSVKYQEDDFGLKLRAALQAKTGCKTIPQMFVGGKFVGGCTDAFDLYDQAKLQTLVADADKTIKATEGLTPKSFLPKWLAKR